MNGAPFSLAGPEGSFILERPQALWALALLAAFILLRLILDRRSQGRRELGLFAPPGIEAGPLPSGNASRTRVLRMRRRLSQVSFWLSMACLIIALSGPRWGLRIVPEYRRGLDVALALDISRSMEIRDIGLSRLERAAEIGREIVENMAGVRFGIAVSRGRGVLAVPLTNDSDAALSFLAALGASALTGSGTDLEALVDAAAGAFSPSLPSRRVIVLLSDGEALSGSLNEALDRAVLREISLATVGIGSDQGAPIPSEDGLISRRRPQTLRNAAVKSGGIYIDGNSDEAPLLLRSYLESLTSESGAGGGRIEKKARWNLFVMAALFFLGASKCFLLTRRKRRGGSALPVLAVLFLFPLLGACSRFSGKLLVMEGNFYQSQNMYSRAISAYLKALDYPEAIPYAEYGLGSSYQALDEGKAALERFKAAEAALGSASGKGQGRRELAYRIRYNTGLVLFEEEDFEGAAGAFRGALEIDGGRLEAKRNLELSLLSRPRDRSSSTAPGEGEGGQSQGTQALFDYLSGKEQNQWKSQRWIEEVPSSGPDY